ncbi:MAG TPA: S41 family peptidase, partial [Gemmatimonadaceae bacterium]|nr:S41 family peptidase [Gemmatimonadaceae bacterium]
MWAKEYPLDPNDVGLVDTGDPRRPTLRIGEGTLVVSIPSHSPAYAPVLDSLVRRNAARLRATPRLIVDLRGNEGGSSWMTDVLLPYVLSDSLLAARYPERAPAMMLSSPDQVSYARSAFGSDTSAFVRSLLDRLQSHPGRFVTFEPPGEERPEPKPDSIVHGPSRVGVMIDGGTVSASEVFVLRALRSARVTVFGEPTEGALDYQSTAIARVVPSPARWFLGYPTITRDTLLPLDGMRGHGIAPQVRVDWTGLADPIGWVDLFLRRGS